MSELGKCVICGKEAGVLYPLLPGGPAFCSEHHNPKDAGSFGCDFTGPDDFDIPFPGEGMPFLRKFDDAFVGDRKTFVWTDKNGVAHELVDIDDRYLQNIINFLRLRVVGMDEVSTEYWRAVVKFLEEEQRVRKGGGR